MFIVAFSVWAYEFNIISELPFANIYTNSITLLELFLFHYYVYVVSGRYKKLATALKSNLKNKGWLIRSVLVPIAIAFAILFGYIAYA